MKSSIKKYDVLVAGELNVDLIMNKLSAFPEEGKEVFAEQMTLTLGSSAAIFASNLSSLGASVAFIGKVGNDAFGDLVIQSLQKNNVDTSMIIRSNDLVTGATVGFNLGVDRAAVTYAGAMEQLTFDDIPLEKFEHARHLHFSSYFFQPGIRQNVGDLFYEAKRAGMSTSFDMQCDPADKWDINYKAILPYVDIFLPNEKELLIITKNKNLDNAIAELKDIVKILAVKLGDKGSVVAYSNKVNYQHAFAVDNLIDTIGAGDSFDAGFIFKFLQNASIETCQSFGNLVGAISTTAAGGTTAFHDLTNLIEYAREKFGYTEKSFT